MNYSPCGKGVKGFWRKNTQWWGCHWEAEMFSAFSSCGFSLFPRAIPWLCSIIRCKWEISTSGNRGAEGIWTFKDFGVDASQNKIFLLPFPLCLSASQWVHQWDMCLMAALAPSSSFILVSLLQSNPANKKILSNFLLLLPFNRVKLK